MDAETMFSPPTFTKGDIAAMAANTSDFVLGIDLGGTKIALATATAEGVIIYKQILATKAYQGAEQAIDRTIATARQLVEQTHAEHDGALMGIGIANMGITQEDHVLMAPNVPGWDHLAILPLVRQAFPTAPVCIENDVKAAAYAELRWGALAGVDVGLYLNLGTGIAAALIVNGGIVRGAHGAAGEIAYNLRHPHDEIGFQQGRAPLEEFVGGRAIGERAHLLFGQPSTAKEIFQLASSNPEARAFVDATLTEIAFHVTNLTIALDPERIVLGGGLMHSKELVLSRLNTYIKRFTPFQPLMQEAYFSHNAGLMGAIALAPSS
jgi:glucokinase